jgi:hypothetical protein
MFFSSSCNHSNRGLYLEELIGGFGLISLEYSGVSFKNAIIETETFNDRHYNQIY